MAKVDNSEGFSVGQRLLPGRPCPLRATGSLSLVRAAEGWVRTASIAFSEHRARDGEFVVQFLVGDDFEVFDGAEFAFEGGDAAVLR